MTMPTSSPSAFPRTLADAALLGPTGLRDRAGANALLVVLFSLLVGACAQVSFRLPFTPVPVTGQTFGVLLAGALLGGRCGAAALFLYLAEGAAGLPVFAGGASGVHHFAGPTGGYLVAYPLAAGLVGLLAERGWDRRPQRAALALLLGSLVIFGLGALWLAPFVGGLGPALVQGVLPFVPGDVAKAALAACLLPGGWRLLAGASELPGRSEE